MSKFLDLTGKRFGKLVVLEIDKNPNNKRTKWICVCDCGKVVSTASHQLVSGNTKSCGCKRRETKNNKHGMRHTRIYEIWCGIKQRCYNKNDKSYSKYGGRGIFMCEEWKEDFLTFYLWSISHGYKDNLTIDRIDNNGNYEPNNCRWITHAEQQRNRTNNIFIEKCGVNKTISEWALEMNVDVKTAYQRYKRNINSKKPIDFNYIFSSKNHCIKPINQYSIDGKFIKKWESATLAGKNGFSRISILQCCKGKTKTSSGYIWKYAED